MSQASENSSATSGQIFRRPSSSEWISWAQRLDEDKVMRDHSSGSIFATLRIEESSATLSAHPPSLWLVIDLCECVPVDPEGILVPASSETSESPSPSPRCPDERIVGRRGTHAYFLLLISTRSVSPASRSSAKCVKIAERKSFFSSASEFIFLSWSAPISDRVVSTLLTVFAQKCCSPRHRSAPLRKLQQERGKA